MGNPYVKRLPPELRKRLERINAQPRWDVEVRRRVAGETLHLAADWLDPSRVTLTNAEVTSRGVVRCQGMAATMGESLSAASQLLFRDEPSGNVTNTDGDTWPQRIAFGLDYFPNPDVLGTGEIRLLGVDVYLGREFDDDGEYWGAGDPKAAMRVRVLTASDEWDLVPLLSDRFITPGEIALNGGVLSLDFSDVLLRFRPERVMTRSWAFQPPGPLISLPGSGVRQVVSYRPISLELMPLGDNERNTGDAFLGGGVPLNLSSFLNWGAYQGGILYTGPAPPGAGDGGGQLSGEFDARTLWGAIPGFGAVPDVHGDGKTYGWFGLSQRLTRRLGGYTDGRVFSRESNWRLPYVRWKIEKYTAPFQVVVNIDLGSTPTEGVGEWRAEYTEPDGTRIKITGSAAGVPIEPDVQDGKVFAGRAQTYQLRVTGTPSADGYSTPELHELGVEFFAAESFGELAFDVPDAESTIDPMECKPSVAELPVTIGRAGAPIRRDGKDPATRLVSENYPTGLSLDLWLGAGKPKQRSRNLVRNSDLNRDSDGDGRADGVTTSAHADFVVTYLGIEDDAQKFSVTRVAETGGWGGGIRIDVPGIMQGDVISAAIEIRVDPDSVLTDARFFWEYVNDLTGALVQSGPVFYPGTGGWVRLVRENRTIDFPVRDGNLRLMARIGTSGAAPLGPLATIWVRRAQVVRGPQVGPYDPNPPHGQERLHLNRYQVVRRRPTALGEELVGASLLERLQVSVPTFQQIGTDGFGNPIYERPSREWLDVDLADVLRDLLTNVLNIPDRLLDLSALPAATGFTTRMRIEGTDPEDGKELADQVAFLCGGSLDWEGGRLTYVELFGAVDVGEPFAAKETVEVWTEYDYDMLEVDPGLEHRLPEYYTWFGPDVVGGTKFRAQVRSVNADALELLGKVHAEERHEAPESVSRWCSGGNGDDQRLAAAVGYRMVRAFGAGFRRMVVETPRPRPWIRRGAQVVVVTDRWTDRLPQLDGLGRDIGRPLRGRVAVPAIVIGKNERGTRWTLWVRDPQNIVAIEQSQGAVRGALDLPPHVTDFVAVDLGRAHELDMPRALFRCSFPDWPHLDGWVVEVRAEGETEWRSIASAQTNEFIAVIPGGVHQEFRARSRSALGRLADETTAPTAVLTPNARNMITSLNARFSQSNRWLIVDVGYGPGTRGIRVEITPVPPNAVGGAVSDWPTFAQTNRMTILPEDGSQPVAKVILFEPNDPNDYTVIVTPYPGWDPVANTVVGAPGESRQVTLESPRSRRVFPDGFVLPIGPGKWLPE
jgi:hypothetical protein